MLPQAFLEKMQTLLKNEYPDFAACFDRPAYKSLRINRLKGTAQTFKSYVNWNLEPVLWCEDGFYYGDDIQPGKHPYHETGAYYIQEASAMLPAVLLDAQPGEKVLDLCAAPGGKSTEIASAMQNKGLLICNEIIPNRARILSENIERMGIRNALVTNESPDRLARKFPGYFDRIMVDAPCSGEGMFRKNDEACAEWSEENSTLCHYRQMEILNNAAKMLSSGGRIVYSTCTFSPSENENTIYQFLKEHPDFSVIKPALSRPEFDTGHFDWIEEKDLDINYQCQIENCIRLWPHQLKGEGHFAVVLEKTSQESDNPKIKLEKGISEKNFKEFFEFQKNYLNSPLEGLFTKFGNQLYLLPKQTPDLSGLKVLRPGLHLGTLLKNRFEPSHALALSLSKHDVRQSCSVDLNTAALYLNGQTFSFDQGKGWYLISVDGYSLGWGKCNGGIMKNHYPKGLRKNI